MPRSERPVIACVEDADESGNPIAKTARYASSSVAPSSPTKEQPNTSRARKERARRGSSSPLTSSALTDSDSTVNPRRDTLKKPSKDREKSVSGSKKALMPSSRPPVKHPKTTSSLPRREGEQVYYGIEPDHDITPASSRPRATSRPASYYATSRPPQANRGFYMNHPPPPPSSVPSSFPAPPWMGPGPGPGPGPAPPFGTPPLPPPPGPVIMQQPFMPHPPPSEIYSRPLEHRFGRPQSSMGFRPPRAIEYDEHEEEPPIDRALARRPSMSRKVSRADEDRRAMPPPLRRPASARPAELAFRPPPSTPARRTAMYDEDDPENPLFQDISPFAPGSYGHSSPIHTAAIPFRPRPSFGADIGHDIPDFETDVGGRYRRNSYYGPPPPAPGDAYVDKFNQARRYQEDVAGPQLPLTAESLRKAGRNTASTRSTRSSGSHDESDYRQSATTRTTKSSANDENFTIKVKGGTTLKFGGAEMRCEDGAEINISTGPGNTGIRTSASDRSSYIDQDDRRTRIDIPAGRSRAKSRARSYSRNIARYDARPEFDTYTTYGASPLPPAFPPYPSYPSSFGSRPEDGYFDRRL
ncbi:hypothetical protein VTK26DRAFT_5643 [Humicola hyalothermophila]